MYKTISDFIRDWKSESESTIKVLANLSDDSLKYMSHQGGRTIGFLAWHIVITVGEMMNKSGLKVECPEENSPEPASAKEIENTYKNVSASMVKEIESKWTDATLDEELDLYGETWKIGYLLRSLVYHQIHHRGQLTILMRQAKLPVPGVYGPSREEWSQMGMEPMK
ncbi:MAG TPA: DinB family protein [Ignavibacteria bacterium]